MITLKIDDNFKKRYLNFISSNIFKEKNFLSKTEYWEYFSKKFKFSIKGDILKIFGESGFYYSEKNFFKSIKYNIKKIFKFFHINEIRFLDYNLAFDKIVEKQVKSYNKIISSQNKLIVKSYDDIRKKFPFKRFFINENIIKNYYNVNLLNNYIDLKNINTVLEIGPGSSNLTSLLKYHYSIKSFILIDLPETLTSSIPLVHHFFPNAKILFPNENIKKIDQTSIKEHDFIFLTPNQINLLDNDIVDLSINTDSFQEMNLEQINLYIDLIQRVSKKDSHFFLRNRIEKYPINSINHDKKFNTEATKFFDYKFHNNCIKFFEICELSLYTQMHPVFIRLEKIIK